MNIKCVIIKHKHLKYCETNKTDDTNKTRGVLIKHKY